MVRVARPYTHGFCGVCRQKQDFKFLPQEHDERGRTLMVCTRCNSKVPAPQRTAR